MSEQGRTDVIRCYCQSNSEQFHWVNKNETANFQQLATVSKQMLNVLKYLLNGPVFFDKLGGCYILDWFVCSSIENADHDC